VPRGSRSEVLGACRFGLLLAQSKMLISASDIRTVYASFLISSPALPCTSVIVESLASISAAQRAAPTIRHISKVRKWEKVATNQCS
jgi:hypothetical protein